MGRPGFGWAAAAWSSEVSSDVTKASAVALSGLTAAAGGMARLLTFRTTFSRISPLRATSLRFTLSSDNPAVRNLSLWQATQYFFRKLRCPAREELSCPSAIAPGASKIHRTPYSDNDRDLVVRIILPVLYSER